MILLAGHPGGAAPLGLYEGIRKYFPRIVLIALSLSRERERSDTPPLLHHDEHHLCTITNTNMELGMNRYYLAALAAIAAVDAFSTLNKAVVPRESSSLHYLHGFRCRRRCRTIYFSSWTFFTAVNSEEDAFSSDERLVSSSGKNSVFEQIFRIPMPWDDDETPQSSQPQRQSTWQWQWPNSGSPPSSIHTPNKSKSSSPSDRRINVGNHVLQTNYNTTKLNDNNSTIDSNSNATINAGVNSTTFRGEQSLHQANSRLPKLGILLIDHGSKRKASNEHLHSIAQSYQANWESATAAKTADSGSGDISTFNVVVRAAHMEIATPSIETQLHQLVTRDKVTHAICVPYFLSPGKHATIDVPNLINEARNQLDKEGHLEYEGGDGEGKRRVVEIYTTKSVGSYVDSMLNVVDDLVRIALNERDGENPCQLDGNHGGHHTGNGNGEQYHVHDTPSANIIRMNELQKYSNRAVLLENVLQLNTKQLTTMKNRAMLLENALKRLQIKWKKEEAESLEERENQEKIFAEQAVNLTATIEAITLEKDTMFQTFENRRIVVESEYNTTIGNLDVKIIVLEQELMRLKDESKHANSHTDKRKMYLEELDDKSWQQERIHELQIKLAELLDAHNQLEQLQYDTERAMLDANTELKELNVTYESSLRKEQEEKEKLRIKWIDAQRQIEQNGARLYRMLDETTRKYEEMLEEERGIALEWKNKWEAVKDEQSSPSNLELPRNSAYDQTTGSTIIEQEISETEKFKADAIDRVQTLEAELKQLKEQYESSSARKEEQQQQLEKYLRAQLSTYYESIQSQSSQITKYEEEIADMGQRHNESILIAASSVEASMRREENLLTNIEELESELLIAKKERDSRQDELSALQVRLHKMEVLQSHSEMLERRNEELAMKLELLENISIESESSENGGKSNFGTSSRHSQHQRFKWVRVVFRPFALFRRK